MKIVMNRRSSESCYIEDNFLGSLWRNDTNREIYMFSQISPRVYTMIGLSSGNRYDDNSSGDDFQRLTEGFTLLEKKYKLKAIKNNACNSI